MSIVPTPWLLKSYSASVEAWSASMAQSASEMSASIAQSAENLSNRIDNINVSIPQSANWESTYNTVLNGSANWNDTYTEFAKISGYDYSTINMAASAVSANSGSWNDTAGTVKTSASNWGDVYDTVKEYSGTWGEGEATIPQSANWESTYGSVSTNSAKWMSTYNDMSTNSSKYDDTYTTVESSASNWDDVYDTVYSNSGAWGHGGITEIEVDNTTLSGDGINEAIGIKGPMLGLSAGPNIKIFEKDDNIVISGAEPKAGGLDKVEVFTEQLSGDGTSNQPIGIAEDFLPLIVSRYRKSSEDTDVGYIGKALYVFHENNTGKKYNYIEIEDKADTQQKFKMYTLGQPWSDMLSAGNGLSASAVPGAGSTTNGHWQVGIQLPEGATENDDYVYTTTGWKKYEGGGDYLPLSGGTVSGDVGILNKNLIISAGNISIKHATDDTLMTFDNVSDYFAYAGGAFIKRHDDTGVNDNMAAFGVVPSIKLADVDNLQQDTSLLDLTTTNPIGVLQRGGGNKNGWSAWNFRCVFANMIHDSNTTVSDDWIGDNTLHFILEPES